jgi:hypothetical protein
MRFSWYNQLRGLGESTPEGLILACYGPSWERAVLLPTLWCLIARGIISCDLNEPLTMRSTLWLVD